MFLPNRSLSAEKQLSERLRLKYEDKKSTGETIILTKILLQTPTLHMFFFLWKKPFCPDPY
jgi:hypothetical protein